MAKTIDAKKTNEATILRLVRESARKGRPFNPVGCMRVALWNALERLETAGRVRWSKKLHGYTTMNATNVCPACGRDATDEGECGTCANCSRELCLHRYASCAALAAARETRTLVEGTLAILTFRDRSGVRLVPAKIGMVDAAPAAGIARFSYRYQDAARGSWGVATLRATPAPFGLQKVEVLS